MVAPDPDGTIVLPEQFIDLCSYAGELSGWTAPIIALIVTLVVTVSAIFWIRARTRRGKRNRAAWAVSGIGIGLAVLLTIALGLNSYVGYVPSIAAIGRWMSGATQNSITDHAGTSAANTASRPHTTSTHGVSFQTSIRSTSSQVPDSTAWVYLPPGYDQDGDGIRYRLVIGLHGDPGKGVDWFAGGRIDTTLDTLIESGALPPVVFISPDLSAGMGLDYREPVDVPGGPQIESYVATDVVGWADQHLRTTAVTSDRIIAGFSSGGYGALTIGLRHTDVFAGIVSIIPYTVPYTTSIKNDPQLYSQYNPAIAISHATRIPPTFLGMAGAETPKNGIALAAALQSRQATFTKRVFPGQPHTWQTARMIMPYGLVWMANQLGWAAPLDSDMSQFPAACAPESNE